MNLLGCAVGGGVPGDGAGVGLVATGNLVDADPIVGPAVRGDVLAQCAEELDERRAYLAADDRRGLCLARRGASRLEQHVLGVIQRQIVLQLLDRVDHPYPGGGSAASDLRPIAFGQRTEHAWQRGQAGQVGVGAVRAGGAHHRKGLEHQPLGTDVSVGGHVRGPEAVFGVGGRAAGQADQYVTVDLLIGGQLSRIEVVRPLLNRAQRCRRFGIGLRVGVVDQVVEFIEPQQGGVPRVVGVPDAEVLFAQRGQECRGFGRVHVRTGSVRRRWTASDR